jgi:RNA polymerase sigma-32 factor
MGTGSGQKKLFFNLRKLKDKLAPLSDGDLRPDQVEQIATLLGVAAQDVIDMNRRFGGDTSLNMANGQEGDDEWQDWLVDDSASQETQLAESEETGQRRMALGEGLKVLNGRERRIFEGAPARRRTGEARRLASQYAISRERVRQIETETFKKVQKATMRWMQSKIPAAIAAAN